MTPRCRHGHLYTEANTRWYTNAGKPYRQCRTCASNRMRLKYRNDEAYREKQKHRCLARYYARHGDTRNAAGRHPEKVHAEPADVGHATV